MDYFSHHYSRRLGLVTPDSEVFVLVKQNNPNKCAMGRDYIAPLCENCHYYLM